MGFFDEFGKLMKKYNFQIYTLQADQNVKIMNDKYKTNIPKEDIPPPIILFRTSEGDFVSQNFGTVNMKNGEQNVKFIDIKDKNIVINPFVKKRKSRQKKTKT